MAICARYLFSELLVISRGITFSGLYHGHNVQAVRTLYSASNLGVEGYVKFRDRVQTQFVNISDTFRAKMKLFTEPSCQNMVFTEDLKNMLHLAQPGNKEDVDIVMNMINRYNKQNKEMRFGSFCFGPVVMRMLYFLNEPSIALQALKSPELDGFFDQVSSYQVAMDLFFNNGMYQDILDILDIMKSKQLHETRYPKNPVLLTYAACYKLNTPESFKYAQNLWKELQEVGHVTLRRSVTFAAALALNQNAPHIALEMLSTVANTNYITVMNIKLAALADIGRPEDAFPILRQILEHDSAAEPRATIMKNMMEKISTSLATSGNEASIREFQEIEKFLGERGNISESITLEELLCKEINMTLKPGFVKSHDRRSTEASFNRRTQRRPTKSFNRPGLQDFE